MLDVLNLFSNSNIWDLDDLSYSGPLFHYTNPSALAKIQTPPSDFPSDCISLQFTRIDCMTKNDHEERRHIKATVKETAIQLFNNAKISRTFMETVCNYIPTDCSTYMLITDETDYGFCKPQNKIMLNYGEVDYYVACFSTNSNNHSIQRDFKASVRISFHPHFVTPDKSIKEKDNFFTLGPVSEFYPYKALAECNIVPYFKKVVYDSTQKAQLVARFLLDIYKQDLSQAEIAYELQSMYALYEAFFKDNKFKCESEVRFVICLPRASLPNALKTAHIIFDNTKEHLYLPIDNYFITNISLYKS